MGVLVAYGFIPFQWKISSYNWQEKFPKTKANVDRSVAVQEVQRYVQGSKSLQAGFLSILGSMVSSSIGCGAGPESLQEEPSTGPARAPSSISKEEVLQLVYFPMAGRGELCRLLAAVGGVPFEDQPPPADESHKNEFTGSLPQMKHGDFKLTQSGAIESYIAAIAPKFQGLTSQQRAIDDCYAATKEDIIQSMGKVVFGQGKEKETALKNLPATLDKFLSVLEDKAPVQGFPFRRAIRRQTMTGRASSPRSKHWWSERREHPESKSTWRRRRVSAPSPSECTSIGMFRNLSFRWIRNSTEGGSACPGELDP